MVKWKCWVEEQTNAFLFHFIIEITSISYVCFLRFMMFVYVSIQSYRQTPQSSVDVMQILCTIMRWVVTLESFGATSNINFAVSAVTIRSQSITFVNKICTSTQHHNREDDCNITFPRVKSVCGKSELIFPFQINCIFSEHYNLWHSAATKHLCVYLSYCIFSLDYLLYIK